MEMRLHTCGDVFSIQSGVDEGLGESVREALLSNATTAQHPESYERGKSCYIPYVGRVMSICT